MNSKEGERHILYVSARSLSRGGVQMVFLNMLRHSPPEYSYTWYFPGKQDECFAEEFRREGVKLVCGGVDLFHCKREKLYRKVMSDIWCLCHEEKYDILHVNTGIRSFQAVALAAGRWSRVPRRIAHCHSCDAPDHREKLSGKILWLATQMLIRYGATDYAGCSRKAAQYLCGAERLKDAMIIPNPVEVMNYAFSKQTRDRRREELGLKDALVFGHVGVFNGVKNQKFLVDVLHEAVLYNEKARLLFVGEGRLEEETRQYAAKLGLGKKVVFKGYTGHVGEYLSAMDVFVFPSRYEGLGNAVIEAQISGLPCVMSDVIPPEANVTGECLCLPLKIGPKKWAEQLMKTPVPPDSARAQAWKRVRGTACDSDNTEMYLRKLYE